VSEKKRDDEEDEKDDQEEADEEESEKDDADEDEAEESKGADEEEDESDEDDAKASKSAKKDDDEADEEEAAEEDDEDEEEEEEDEADPEAIAKRVAALGEEDESEVLAREEERKLAARRKKGRGKRGLQKAASKRLKKIAAKAPKRRRPVATAIDAADPLLERTARIGEWAQKNQKIVWGVAAIAAIAAMIFGGVTYADKKKSNEASAILAQAVADERGRIGDDKEKEDDEDRPKDLTPVFKTAEDRREAALGKYREVSSKFPGTGAATLARLAEGSLLLDKREPDPAASAFTDVKGSALAQADSEVRGRSLEGLGFAYELKAAMTPAEKDRYLDDAIKQFRELENSDVSGFKELAMYHQARCNEEKGDKEKAKELLKSLHERLTQPGASLHMTYLQNVADDRLRALDPLALPPKPAGMLGGPGGNKLTEAQIRALFEQLQKKQQQQGQEP